MAPLKAEPIQTLQMAQNARTAPRAAPRSGPREEQMFDQTRADANSGAVGIVTARSMANTLIEVTLDMSTLLDKGERFEEMRVIPMISRGKMQNLWDVLYLRGVDAGFVQTDTLEALKNDRSYESIRSRLRYIAPMFPEELHIVARQEIRTLKDLAGKRISVNARGSGTAITVPIILQRLGIDAQIEYLDTAPALEQMRNGTLAAHATILGKPTQVITTIRDTGFHLLAVPYTKELTDFYVPTNFTSKDYPNIIRDGEEVPTVAVGTVLAVFNWQEGSERYEKVARFVNALFDRFDELRGPGFHPKWREVNFAATVPGWTRFKPAQDWLDRHAVAARRPR